jgi:transposase InsO family protein
MADDGSAYRSRDFARALAAAGVAHQRIKPCTP